MQESGYLDVISTIGSISTPFLVLVLAGIGWMIRSRFERIAELENNLREDRIKIYNEILEPFIILLTPDAVWKIEGNKNKNQNKDEFATKKILSLQYRMTCFRLALMGSDSVVRSFNELFQFFYSSSNSQTESKTVDIAKIMSLLGNFLLQIRKSMGNEATELDNWDMIEWFVKDARMYKENS